MNNKILTVIEIDGITHIIYTFGDEEDIYVWSLETAYILDYFHKPLDASSLNVTFTMDDYTKFVNDEDNATIGVSSGSFENASDARRYVYANF